MAPAVSFATKYGAATSVVFLIQTTFSAAKYVDTGSGDVVATPFASLSNLLLFALYAGFFVIGGLREIRNAPAFYLGGLGLYTFGYLMFGIAAGVTWFEGSDAIVKILNILGGSGFTFGSVFLVVLATPPWGDRDYKPDCRKPIGDVLCGPPSAWHGCLSFLLGSMFFLTGSLLDVMPDAPNTAPLYMIGILIFVPGRVFFVVAAVRAVQQGLEFRYGRSNPHHENVAAGLAMGMRLFAAICRTREEDPECAHRRMWSQSTEALPGGSWVRKAVKNIDGRYGRVELKDGKTVLMTTISRNDGSHVHTEVPFKPMDTFSCWNGQLNPGRTAGTGRLTTRDVIFMCDLYDELDNCGAGYLTPQTLHTFAHAVGLHDLSEDDIERLVADLDLDGGSHLTNGQLGLDFPEFMTLLSGSLGDGHHCISEMDHLWRHITKDSISGNLEAQCLTNWLKELQMDIDERTVKQFLSTHGAGNGVVTRAELWDLFVDDAHRHRSSDSASKSETSSNAEVSTHVSDPDTISKSDTSSKSDVSLADVQLFDQV